MASRYEISAIFKMVDGMSEPMKRIAGSSTAFAKKMSMDMQRTEMQIQAAGRAMKQMAGVAVAAGVALAGKTVVDSVKTYVEFEDAVTKAGAKFKDVDVTSAEYNQTLEKLQTSAREVGAATMFSATDAAGALEKMAQAGIDSKTSMSILMGTTNLAVAAGTDLTTAVDIATDAMGMFNKSLTNRGITDAADQLNLISDVMAKTGVLANTDLQGLFEGMTYAGPSLSAAGQSIETISASLGMLANVGIKGSSAGTALNAVFTQLGDEKKLKALERMGVKVKDAQGNFLSFSSILGDLEKVTKNMGTAERSSFLNGIFLVQGGKAVNALLDQGTDALKDYIRELENAGGTAEKIAKAQSMSFSGMIEQLKSAWQDKQLSLGKAFEVGGAKEALQNLITYVQNFDVSQIAAALTRIMQAIPGIVEGVVGFIQTLWNMKEVIGSLVAAWGLYKIAVVGALVYEKVLAFMNAIKAVQLATEGMSVAQAALNVVMNANPIGLVITALAALVAIAVTVVKHWDDISAAMAKAWEWIQNISSIIWDKLLTGFEKIKAFFVETGIVDGIKEIGQTIISFVLAPVQKILEVASKIPGIGGKAKEAADAIAAIRNPTEKAVPSVPIIEPPKTNTLNPETFDYYKSLGWDDEDERPTETVEPVSNRSMFSGSVNGEITVRAEKGTSATVKNTSPKNTLSLLKSSSF